MVPRCMTRPDDTEAELASKGTLDTVLAHEVPKEALESLFHLPLKQAATAVGRGTTSFKKICRDAGIARWPYRKLKCLESMVSVVNEMQYGQQRLNEDADFEIFREDCLRAAERVKRDSSFKLQSRNFKRVRQATYKLIHQRRQLQTITSELEDKVRGPATTDPDK